MKIVNRRAVPLAGTSAVALALPAFAAPKRVTLYKNPQCDCCKGYTACLKENGFDLDIVATDDLVTMARQAGVLEQLDGCHITKLDGYVVVGHVPIDAVRKLLAERPKIVGISIPGMPMGVPGIAGPCFVMAS